MKLFIKISVHKNAANTEEVLTEVLDLTDACTFLSARYSQPMLAHSMDIGDKLTYNTSDWRDIIMRIA